MADMIGAITRAAVDGHLSSHCGASGDFGCRLSTLQHLPRKLVLLISELRGRFPFDIT